MLKEKDSLFESYLSEVRSEKTIYADDDAGFLTYVVDKSGAEFYIREIYVRPENRRDGIASALGLKAEILAHEMGCKIMAGTIVRGTRGMTESLQTMLHYGFKLHDWDQTKVVLVKEVTP